MTRCSSATRAPSWFSARRVFDDELQRPALLVVNIGYFGLEGHPIAGADRRVIFERLRAMQDFANRHAHRSDVVPERVGLHLQAEGERRRRRQSLVAGGSRGRFVGIDGVGLADRLGEEFQATFLHVDGLRRRRPPDMLLVDHVPPLEVVGVMCLPGARTTPRPGLIRKRISRGAESQAHSGRVKVAPAVARTVRDGRGVRRGSQEYGRPSERPYSVSLFSSDYFFSARLRISSRLAVIRALIVFVAS